jgi:regulator of sirC expression with transglutaminase-like and TPR domain
MTIVSKHSELTNAFVTVEISMSRRELHRMQAFAKTFVADVRFLCKKTQYYKLRVYLYYILMYTLYSHT